MQPGDARGASSSLRLPKIPDDVVYLIAQFSSFEALVSLVQCNKSLHASCAALLFRDIRLHNPAQLVKLCKNRETFNRLGETQSMFLGEGLFYIDLWVDTGADAFDYLQKTLHAAASLLRLQLFDAPIQGYVSDNLINRLRSMSSDPTFLPKLEVLVGIRSVSLGFLHENRPVKFVCSYEDFDNIVMKTFPSLSSYPTTSPAIRSTLLDKAADLSATEIGSLIRESKGSLLATYPYLDFTARFPEAIRAKGDVPIPDLPAWLQEVVQKADLSSDGVKRLRITFDPSPSRLSSFDQHTIVTKLSELLPQLERATISSLTWNKYHGSFKRSDNFLSLWTPEPGYFSISWWLDALHINLKGAKAQEAKHISAQLREGMRTRHPLAMIPPRDTLENYILDLID